jgi:EmrB/QacA subfamily drug resistance transporter
LTDRSARRWLGLIAIALGVALIVVDITIVSVIIPSIIKDLRISSTQAQWIQESYAIVLAALLLLTGRIADILGARRVFVTGVILFGVTSMIAGIAPDGDLLIAARFVQGTGAAMILPTSLSLLNTSFTGKARDKAFAVWGSTIGAAAALGPVLGGWLAVHASWRWAFGINVPLAVLVCIGVLVFLAPSPQASGRVDIAGAVLSVLGLGLVAFALVEGRIYGWVSTVQPLRLAGLTWDSGPSPVLAALALAAVLLIVFIRRQAVLSRKAGATPALMNIRLFSVSSFRNGNIATLIIGLGEFGIVAVLPLWLQFTLGYSALESGLALIPIAAGSLFASGASFGMVSKLSPLGLVRIGLALEAAGLAGLALIASTHNPWWSISLILFLYGIGVGFATAQVTNVVLADVPGHLAGQGSGIQSAFRQLGSALGIAVLTTVFFTTLGSRLHARLTAAGVPAATSGQLTHAVTASAGAAIRSLAVPEATAAREALTSGIASAGFVAAGFVTLGLLATALIPARHDNHSGESPLASPSQPADHRGDSGDRAIRHGRESLLRPPPNKTCLPPD